MTTLFDRYIGIEREQVAASLTDEELVTATYALVQEVDDPRLSDEFYVVLTEVFERYAPAAEWADKVARLEGDSRIEFELEASRKAMIRRAKHRIRERFVPSFHA